ncbi:MULTISPECIES: hypothetical protein, partial [unclassified Acinetobacter]|uniref:hypothetical protein n=1 Tax=unclassified Acinetobacter TaxID=196816 RepID=UPI001C553B76
MPFFFILSLRQVGHLISRVIRISLFYQNSTCFVSAYFLKHHLRILIQKIKKRAYALFNQHRENHH